MNVWEGPIFHDQDIVPGGRWEYGPPWTIGRLQPREQRGEEEGEAQHNWYWWKLRRRVCILLAAPPCPVNWNTKQSRVDGRAAVAKMKRRRRSRRRRCSRCLSPATFTARWKLTVEAASETDTLSLVKWTVTLHFSTSWQRRIGRFEPCDVTLIEFWFSPPGLQRKQGRFYTKRAGLSTQSIPWKRSLLPSPPLIISLCCFVTLLLS